MNMQIDKQEFLETLQLLKKAAKVRFGPASTEMLLWASEKKLPSELVGLMKIASLQSEMWAGAGTLFSERGIIEWNDSFPKALISSLLIIGSAANGDHICMDMVTGEIGYMSHELEWMSNPRIFFISICASIGVFVRDINLEASKLPDDYWEAKANLL
jgi:hypothetical protein